MPQPSNGSLKVVPVKETKIFPAYLKVEVSFSLEKLDIKRVYRIYDDCPAIACDTYLRGTVNSISEAEKLVQPTGRILNSPKT